jgi:hypothetical protein
VLVSAKGAVSLLSLGQRPRISICIPQALKERLNEVGDRNQAREIESRLQRLS